MPASTFKSEKHRAAAQYVVGYEWKVFPCLPNSKVPATPNGLHAATDDLDQINAWWTENPDYNIAACPADQGMICIETDNYKPEFSQVEFNKLGLPPTFTVESPRGGRHYYYESKAAKTIKPSQGRLGPAVDTRSSASYMLLAPSIVGGKPYKEVTTYSSLAPLPMEIEARLAKNADRIISEIPRDERTRADGLARGHISVLDALERGNISIAGRDGNNTAYKLAVRLAGNMGLTESDIYELMSGEWNAACQPPWPQEELEVIIANACKYRQNDIAQLPASETFKHFTFTAPIEEDEGECFEFMDGASCVNIPKPDWIVKDLIPAGALCILRAPTGSYKSFLALDLSMSVATSTPCFAGEILQTGSVFYGAHEGKHRIASVDYPAWCEKHGKDPASRTGFYLSDGPNIGLNEDAFIRGIKKVVKRGAPQPKLIILDTYSRCMGGLNENDPAAVNQMLAFCNRLLAEWPGCSVLIPSHTGKDAAKGVRGSNAFEAAADTVIELERLEGREVLVKVEKQRCGEENREGWSLKGEKTGESLTFSLCKAQPRGLTGLETSFQAVEKVLRDKGIDTDSAGVTTHVLAEIIWPYKEGGDMSEALWKGFLKDKEKELNKAAKAQLKPLFHGDHKWAAPKQSL